MYKATLILLAICAVHTRATPVTNCLTNSKDTTSVKISGCDSVPCKLIIGATTDVTLTFTPSKDVTSLTNRVSDNYEGFIIRSSIDGTSACNNIREARGNKVVTCPLSKGIKYVYKNSLKIPVEHPEVTATLRWALEFDSVNQACFEVPVQVVRA